MEYRQAQLDRVIDPLNGFIIPFDSEVIIFQGYNGPFSHFPMKKRRRIIDNRYYLDFELPLGTPVIAAHDGVVCRTVSCTTKYYEGLDLNTGMNCSPNLVVLKHNKYYSLYSHLRYGSIEVEIGEHIDQGQTLARTGRSGWIGPAAHLHFGVFSFSDMGNRFSYPVIFDDYSEALEHCRCQPISESRLDRIVA